MNGEEQVLELEQIVESQEVDTSPFVEFGERYLRFHDDTPYEVWEVVVQRLKAAEKSIQWWLGDAIRFGERAYGERYSQALEETDYSYGALRDASWVAGKFEVSSRDDTLSFSHHRAVASLEPHEREQLLSEARPAEGENKPRLSVRKLEAKAKEIRSLPPNKPEGVSDVEEPDWKVIKKLGKVAVFKVNTEFMNGDRNQLNRQALKDLGCEDCPTCGQGVLPPRRT